MSHVFPDSYYAERIQLPWQVVGTDTDSFGVARSGSSKSTSTAMVDLSTTLQLSTSALLLSASTSATLSASSSSSPSSYASTSMIARQLLNTSSPISFSLSSSSLALPNYRLGLPSLDLSGKSEEEQLLHTNLTKPTTRKPAISMLTKRRSLSPSLSPPEEDYKDDDSDDDDDEIHFHKSSPSNKRVRFTISDDETGSIQTQVVVLPPSDCDAADIWWDSQSLIENKQEIQELVETTTSSKSNNDTSTFYRQYKDTIKFLMQSYKEDTCYETLTANVKRIASEATSNTSSNFDKLRGLELHMIPKLRLYRKYTSHSILKFQNELRNQYNTDNATTHSKNNKNQQQQQQSLKFEHPQDQRSNAITNSSTGSNNNDNNNSNNPARTAKLLRKKSLKLSRAPRQLAFRLAQADRLQAKYIYAQQQQA